MRRLSLKRQRADRAAADLRKSWREEFEQCPVCGYGPKNLRPGPMSWSKPNVHEIANGTAHRQKALDKPYATLVVCEFCNLYVLTDKRLWPEARQLAVLKREAQERYDLAAYNALVGRGPNRISPEDVEAWE